MKLRLLITTKCHKSCEGCCNKDWDLAQLPICTSFVGYKEILLTGGEPALDLNRLCYLVERIRDQNPCPIYVYTACPRRIIKVLPWLDGVTLTLHDQGSAEELRGLDFSGLNKSLRLVVFEGIDIEGIDLTPWEVRRSATWIKDCPLPEGEVFMRLEDAQ